MDYRQQAIDRLKAVSLRPSAPRIAIYSYLLEHCCHPTAELIHHALAEKYPTLSLTTVYNTLKLFCQSGIVTALTVENDELRYDVNTTFHAHLKCRKCGSLQDFFPDNAEMKQLPNPGSDFVVESAQLSFYGICSACSSRK